MGICLCEVCVVMGAGATWERDLGWEINGEVVLEAMWLCRFFNLLQIYSVLKIVVWLYANF